MDKELIVRTQVNEVMGGAISNVTLVVEKVGSLVISATIPIGETTMSKMQSAKAYTDNAELIKEAFGAIVAELHARGVEDLTFEAENCSLPAVLDCSATVVEKTSDD